MAIVNKFTSGHKVHNYTAFTSLPLNLQLVYSQCFQSDTINQPLILLAKEQVLQCLTVAIYHFCFCFITTLAQLMEDNQGAIANVRKPITHLIHDWFIYFYTADFGRQC